MAICHPLIMCAVVSFAALGCASQQPAESPDAPDATKAGPKVEDAAGAPGPADGLDAPPTGIDQSPPPEEPTPTDEPTEP